jgi:hypothetical protein
VPGDPAAEQREAQVDESEMHSASNQIVDQNGVTGDAKRFRDEPDDI